MISETDRKHTSQGLLRLAAAWANDFAHEFVADVVPFIKRRPVLALLLSLFAFFLASGELLEIIPGAEPLTQTEAFAHFHQLHDTLGLVLVVLVAYSLNISLAGLLLSVFFAAHLPYFYLTFSEQPMKFIKTVLDSAVVTGYIGMILKRNIALRKVEAARDQSAHLARHDPLTDLPNRALFQLEAQRTMAVAKRNRSKFAVMFIDLNDFKDVNDSLGHDVGDRCLINLAARLRETVREGDVVARLGGDEFAIIANNLDGAEHAAFLADRLITRASEPIVVGEHKLNIGLSVGIALYPAPPREGGAADSMELLSHADMAMYKAKRGGQSSFKFYNHHMSVEASERVALLNELQTAIERNQLTLLYQPLFDIQTGLIVGAEALARWIHPQRGAILPDVFIPAAETSGHIVPIGRWVMEEACTQNRAWQDAGLPHVKISVNLSPVQLKSLPLVETVANALERTGLDANYLDLELTENVFMRNIERSAQILRQLRELGVSLSIDDFGTGYSSLVSLQRLSVDNVKIDRTFVNGAGHGGDSAAIISAVVSLGHSLGLTVTAEGIESEADLNYLRGLGCDYGQGFYFAPALTANEFARLLKENSLKTRA